MLKDNHGSDERDETRQQQRRGHGSLTQIESGWI